MRFPAALLASLIVIALAGCSGERSIADGAVPPAASLPEPDVVMEADPAPPFTYWAPEGSTIRSHPSDPQVWIAETGETRKFYFGDQCLASRYQPHVGQVVETLPEPPADAVWRFSCTTCARTSDLGRERMNIVYEEDTRRVVEIDCG